MPTGHVASTELPFPRRPAWLQSEPNRPAARFGAERSTSPDAGLHDCPVLSNGARSCGRRRCLEKSSRLLNAGQTARMDARGLTVTDTSRVTRSGLQVDAELAAFIDGEALPGSGVAPGAFWDGLAGLVADFGPAERGAAAGARRPAGGHRPLAPRAPRSARPRRVPGDPRARSATSCPGAAVHDRHHRRRPRDRRGGRPAARRAGHQRPLRAQRRQRPVGIAVRRAVRHRRARRLAAARAVRPRTWRTGDRLGAAVPRRRRAAPTARSHADATGYRVVDGALLVACRRRPTQRGLDDPALFAGHAGEAGAPVGGPPRAPRPRHRDRHRPRAPGRPRRRAGVADVVLESAVTAIMDFEDSVAAVDGADKAAGLPQLARPDDGRADRGGRQGRAHVHPDARARPRVHRTRRLRDHSARHAR